MSPSTASGTGLAFSFNFPKPPHALSFLEECAIKHKLYARGWLAAWTTIREDSVMADRIAFQK